MKSPKGYLTWQDVFGRVFVSPGGSPSPVDKSQLISIIDYWDTSSSEHPPENYTPESYQAVLDTYVIAVAVRDNPDATQEEVDTACLNLINAIAGLEKECKYPLDKTDFSDIEQILGVPQGTIVAPTPIDDSYQKFVVNSLEDRILLAIPQGAQITEEEDMFFGNSAPLTMGTTIALKYKALDFELWNEDLYEFRFIVSTEEQSTVDLLNIDLRKSSDYPGLGKFPWNSGQPAPSLNDIPTEGTIVFVREYYYCYMVLNGEIVGTWYNNRVFKPEDIIDWGVVLTGNPANPIEFELITDYDTLSSLLSGVEFTHASPADFKPVTLCGQPLDLTST